MNILFFYINFEYSKLLQTLVRIIYLFIYLFYFILFYFILFIYLLFIHLFVLIFILNNKFC